MVGKKFGEPGPIVITLKNKAPRAYADDIDEAQPADTARTSKTSEAAAGGDEEALALPRDISSPSPQKRSPSREKDSGSAPVLNHAALEDIFARFHGELDNWLQGESSKLDRQEAEGQKSLDSLRRSTRLVLEFLRVHSPTLYEELGADCSGEAFTTKALPQFLDIVNEDRRKLEDASNALRTFASRRFPKNEDIASQKASSSPIPLLKEILRQLEKGGSSASKRGRGGGSCSRSRSRSRG
eukprot:gnl/TRDRNA2_/TRDRNA2_126155_c2_seq2.p1 gnl/TRDRNA2_/TRDRNA2_126155_c2~~gnl/TRDRNA2_/TRDRNA2_126155_c2_seq2.p1  ORF type:complete len:241 (+),score=53.06 gnl/TRDRNA2_/TRDRNA2_126155_c2_seq2:80-802(+)